jgi:hypothetical protein
VKRPIIPTDPIAEQAKGRVALWLDLEDLRWLAQFCACPPDAPVELQDRCARIRFRANAALHKAGIAHNPSASTIDQESSLEH